MQASVLILCSLGTIIFKPISSTISSLHYSPVQPAGNDATIDMWTKTSEGCECQFNPSRKNCACCVKPGGCQCGSSAPNKCAQCGLQQYCNNMCNITISQQSIFFEGKTTAGQIKSPSLQGPALCWYLLQPDPGHRLELQIYRLVDVGRFNGTGCQSGYVHLVDEVDVKSGSMGVQICGQNERFAPPVVLFADKGAATLTFRIEEPTNRSQFYAHYSFTSYDRTQSTGFRPAGGKRINHTGCDWLYQDYSCINEPSGCVLASPGFPGLYPSHITCRYHIATSSLRTKVKIMFTTLSLPHNNCATDYINIYQGTSSSNTLLTTLCSNKKQDYIFSGPNLLIEFKSGATIPPYDYNGFVASLEFIGGFTTTEKTPVTPKTTAKNPNKIPSSSEKSSKRSQGEVTVRQIGRNHTNQPASSGDKQCQKIFFGNTTRSGPFDIRSLPTSTNCIFIFSGQPTDIVQISLFNYQINASSCHSYIEIIDGDIRSNAHKLLKKLCSPVIKHARNSEGKFHEPQHFRSTGNHLSVHFKRHKPQSQGEDYIDGAFNFIDGKAEGTLQPNTLCEHIYYGLTSSSQGRIHNHGTQQLFWNVEGPLRCSQKFIPTANQSVTIQIKDLQKLSSEVCFTQCGDSGCQCFNKQTKREYEHIDDCNHLLILNEHNVPLSCICDLSLLGSLPTIRSWSPITVVYYIEKYNWGAKGFSFEADFSFVYDSACGHRTINHHFGSIAPVPVEQSDSVTYFYHQECTWILNSNIERELFVEISSLQNRPCSAWNVTIYEYVEDSKNHTGRILEQFCPKDNGKVYTLPWKLNVVGVKLSAMTRLLPQYEIKWKSQVVRTNTRLSSPEASANSGSYVIFHILLNVSVFSYVMFYFYTFVYK